MAHQLNLPFVDDFYEIRQEMKQVKLSNEKVRKSLHAKHGDIERRYRELERRLEVIERNICHEVVTK